MHAKFKRHQKVVLLAMPKEDDIELYVPAPHNIRSGTIGFINLLLPNGRYHVRIEDSEGNEVAYVAMDEEQLKAVDA